jgi:uncharacterized protein (UPF0332 family)
MKDRDISDLMEKASHSLGAAGQLLKSGYPDFSVGRSYYAMFYAAEALLLTRNLSFSKHKAVISAIGREFIKTDKLPPELHRYISDAFDARQLGDYGPTGCVSAEKARALMGQAKEFVETVSTFLNISEESK